MKNIGLIHVGSRSGEATRKQAGGAVIVRVKKPWRRCNVRFMHPPLLLSVSFSTPKRRIINTQIKEEKQNLKQKMVQLTVVQISRKAFTHIFPFSSSSFSASPTPCLFTLLPLHHSLQVSYYLISSFSIFIFFFIILFLVFSFFVSSYFDVNEHVFYIFFLIFW